MLSVVTGFETCNKYEIKNSLGQQVYFAREGEPKLFIILNKTVVFWILFTLIRCLNKQINRQNLNLNVKMAVEMV